jgi:signal peptidase I
MKKPWTAAVLSLFCPGLGQLYAGRPVRALVFLLVPLLLTVAMVGLVALEPSGLVLALLVLLCLGAPVIFLYIVIDAHRVASTAAADAKPRAWQHPLVYALVFVVGLAYPLVSAAFLRAEVVEAYKIPTMSMAPTIVRGDRILVRKWGWRSEDVRRGDLVVFIPPDDSRRAHIKRVAGVPGDRVESRDGTEQTVPVGHVWVRGDNVEHSRDSRSFGPVPFANLVGRVTYRFWPPGRAGTLQDRSPERETGDVHEDTPRDAR